MIEILVLFFLTRRIGVLAERKGERPGKWKLYTVLAWFAFEVVGALLSNIVVKDFLINAMFGLFLAFGGYLLVKYRLDNIPDKTEEERNWMDRLGRDNDSPPQ